MNGLKIELAGIGAILFGIALSTNNVISYTVGLVGVAIIALGCFWNK